ncbi:MAG TPA: S8 family serine peptidase [Thermoanaerobaculia bacterium]
MSTVLFAVSVSALAESRTTRNIIGLSSDAVARLPGAARLFEVRNASAAPRILAHDFVPGQVVARFPPEVSDEEVEQLAWLSGADRVERLSPLGLFLFYGHPSRRATERLMEKLWEARLAVDVEANYVGELAFVPNDPHHGNGDQWYHEAPSDIDLDLAGAWDVTRGSEEVVVALIDSGIRLDHPEFFGRLYVNLGETPGNLIDDDGNGYVDDVSGWSVVTPVSGNVNDTVVGHGTRVASILLASADNGHQVAGFDHFAKLLPIKTFAGAPGQGAALVASLDYLIANPGIAKIVNMSLADFAPSTMLGNALSAVAMSSILIGGSGNNGADEADSDYPESHPDVITIGGTDSTDALAFFPIINLTAATGNSLDFAAPAVGIYTASFAEPNNPAAADVGDGTSFATPMISGTASLCFAIRPSMTKSDLIVALRESAVDLGVPGRDKEFGWGRPNTRVALLTIQSMVFTDDFETGDTTAWSSSFP